MIVYLPEFVDVLVAELSLEVHQKPPEAEVQIVGLLTLCGRRHHGSRFAKGKVK